MKRADKTAERRTIAEIKRVIVGQFAPVQLLLFGSRAKGNALPDSDYDIAVILREAPDTYRAAIAVRTALCGLRVPIDVLVFDQQHWQSWSASPVTTEHHIRQTAKVLYDAAA